MRTYFEHNIRLKTQRLADLKLKAAKLERKLSDAGISIEREFAPFTRVREATRDQVPVGHRSARGDAGRQYGADGAAHAAREPSPEPDGTDIGAQDQWPDERTEVLVNHGRPSAYGRRISRRSKAAIAGILVAALLTVLVLILTGGGASWPASVARVQSEVAIACQNPDVKSEPGQVNFTCAKSTRQVLWVFALMTSANNPSFFDAKTGRMGLEPIAPAQGGEVAWSLNLHHPYNPASPIDSLEVAARALNNIIAGATVTGANGSPVVQPGLESQAANCLRYTASAAVTARAGFPGLCAKPVTSAAGQAALVADLYQRWVVGAAPTAAQDAAVLFENAQNPGDPQVQAILTQLRASAPLA